MDCKFSYFFLINKKKHKNPFFFLSFEQFTGDKIHKPMIYIALQRLLLFRFIR
jgi:hypothetical protein